MAAIASPDATARAKQVKLAVFDVDGVMTDGTLWYGPQGEVMKAFNTLDGHGLKLLSRAGVRTAILSGRRSDAVTHRARELGIEHVLQGIEHKLPAFESLLRDAGLEAMQTSYAGDDVMDIAVLKRCGFACAPAQSHERAIAAAHFVPAAAAGRGAVREICEFILRAQARLDDVLEDA